MVHHNHLIIIIVTLIQVLRPVTILLTGATPEGSGLHIDLTASEVRLSVSPGKIIHLFSSLLLLPMNN